MEILYILLVLLISTRILGELSKRIGFPSILGEISAGIILGVVFHQYSSELPILSSLEENEVFHAIKDLSIFFLMLYAGLELKPKEFKQSSGNAFWIALGGIILPLTLGMGAGWFLLPETNNQFTLMLFIGVVLSITAVPVAVKLLMDLGKLNSPVGKSIVSAAVIDDVISLLLLAILTSLISSESAVSASGILILVSKIIGFFIITILLGRFIIPKMSRWVSTKVQGDEIEISFLLIVALSFSVLAELMGLHFIMGAFVAGLFCVQKDMKENAFEGIKNKVKGISTGFLAPIFFASIGLSLDPSAFTKIPWVIAILILLATLGKVIGTAIPAYLAGFSKKDILTIGFSMNARGVVSIIIADIVLKAGLFQQTGDSSIIISNLFSAVVIMAIVTTMITPLALKVLLRK